MSDPVHIAPASGRSDDPNAVDAQDTTALDIDEKDAAYNTNVEAVNDDPAAAKPYLKRDLKGRHLQMVAIGGVLGPGYFFGMGSGLSNGGPGGLLIGFLTVGSLLWAVMQSLAEMSSFIAVSGAFTHFTTRFMDPALGFSLGWNYAFLWFGIIAAEYQNLGLIMTYWKSAMSIYGFILIFWFAFLFFSYLGVLAFGEAEYAITFIKLLFIVSMYTCCVLITTGAIGDGDKIGFKYWHDPGAFADGVAGVFKVFVFAALQYSGTEMIGFTAGESADPARDVPRAVRFVFWRVVIFFLGGIFFLSLVVPWNDPDLLSATSKTARAPYTIAFSRVGLPKGGDAVNAIVLVTLISTLNAGLYVTSRCIAAMALEGQAPKVFGKINKQGVPWVALIFCNLFGFLALLNLSAGAGVIYGWLVNISGVATFITWACICAAHIRFRNGLTRHGISLDELPFKASFYPYGAWFGLIGNLFFIFFQGWTCFLSPLSVSDFFENYMMIGVFIVLYGGYKLYFKTKWVNIEDMGLHSDRRDWKAVVTKDEESKGFTARVKRLVIG